MFGYVRPEKPILLMRDFALYKSVYCGLCKALGRRYGQISRAAVTFDMTFLAIVLMAFAPEDPHIREEGCILNPIKKKPIMVDNAVLDYVADLSCLLAYASARDNALDDQPIRGTVETLLFLRAGKKAKRLQPEAARSISASLEALSELEKGEPTFEAAMVFGRLISEVTAIGFDVVARLWGTLSSENESKILSNQDKGLFISQDLPNDQTHSEEKPSSAPDSAFLESISHSQDIVSGESISFSSDDATEEALPYSPEDVFYDSDSHSQDDGAEEALPFSPEDKDGKETSFYRYMIREAMCALGQWVYLIDAIDDLEKDRKKKNWNPFLRFSSEEAKSEAKTRLSLAEETVDRGFALLSYPRMGALVYNVVVHGLPRTRQRVLAGEKLPRI